MPLGGSGFLTEAVLGKANEKLEQAIEDLRIKYEKKAKIEAEEAAAKAKEKAAEVEGKKSTEPEMSMEDPELEALRQVGAVEISVGLANVGESPHSLECDDDVAVKQ
jgi:hypothetical protein